MRLRNTENTLDVLLRHCYVTPRCQSIQRYRHYSSTPAPIPRNQEVKDVAVLGGGITGLASAFYLSQELPDAKITLYEGSSRLGGWLQSKHIDVGNGQVVFEQGPRTLRPTSPNGLLTLDLVHQLGLTEDLLTTHRTADAAKNRFIYYPDHLVRMPGPGANFFNQTYSFLTEPIWSGVALGALKEIFQPPRPSSLPDESIGSFISRRFSPQLANNVVSAVLHGIYAGDVWKLSMKSIQPMLWFLEGRHGSITNAVIENWKNKSHYIPQSDVDITRELAAKPSVMSMRPVIEGTSVYTFKRGLGQLADELQARIKKTKNIHIKMSTSIHEIALDEKSGGLDVTSKKALSPSRPAPRQNQTYTHVISTLSSQKMAFLCHPIVAPLVMSRTVTVMVVNLFFRNPNLLSVHGFGYLMPRSIPFEQNPERALGVVFDSDATIGQDAVPGTKLTVMLGGHWWDDWRSFPDEDEGAQMARNILARHLNITEEPASIHVSLQKDCIPQYTVGHERRMGDASRDLQRQFKGRLRVAGNSYTGVGLNDCVRAARDVVKRLVAADGRFDTGLESFTQEKTWAMLKARPVSSPS